MAKRVNYRDQVSSDGELDLSMSDLQEVPVRDIAQAKKATSLDLSNNHLTSIGKNFPTLTHLVKLDLSKNQISSLPVNFGDLVLLRHLDLYSNKLSHLPLSFGQLRNLKWLDLKNNPLVPALLEIAGPCIDAKQCQTCAKKVVEVLANSQKRLEEEQQRQAREELAQAMAEKAAAKKEQQKKKATKNEKKKNVENGVRPQEQSQRPPQKKKDKGNKQVNKAPPKKSGSFIGKLFKLGTLVALGLAALYYFDIDKFNAVKIGSQKALNNAIDLLPPQTFVYLNQTSTFLNTDPRVKDHWANLKTVAGVIQNRTVELASHVIAVAPVYLNDAKRFIFEKKTET